MNNSRPRKTQQQIDQLPHARLRPHAVSDDEDSTLQGDPLRHGLVANSAAPKAHPHDYAHRQRRWHEKGRREIHAAHTRMHTTWTSNLSTASHTLSARRRKIQRRRELSSPQRKNCLHGLNVDVHRHQEERRDAVYTTALPHPQLVAGIAVSRRQRKLKVPPPLSALTR